MTLHRDGYVLDTEGMDGACDWIPGVRTSIAVCVAIMPQQPDTWVWGIGKQVQAPGDTARCQSSPNGGHVAGCGGRTLYVGIFGLTRAQSLAQRRKRPGLAWWTPGSGGWLFCFVRRDPQRPT
jgi:hypothetical protein